MFLFFYSFFIFVCVYFFREPTWFPKDLFDWENKTSVSSSTTPMNHHPPARSVAKEYKRSKFAFPADLLEPRDSLDAIYETKFHPELKRPLLDCALRQSLYSRNYRGPVIYQGKNSKNVVSMESAGNASTSSVTLSSKSSVSKYSDFFGLPSFGLPTASLGSASLVKTTIRN